MKLSELIDEEDIKVSISNVGENQEVVKQKKEKVEDFETNLLKKVPGAKIVKNVDAGKLKTLQLKDNTGNVIDASFDKEMATKDPKAVEKVSTEIINARKAKQNQQKGIGNVGT